MDIVLTRHPDCEGDNNRGFRCDCLELSVDGVPAGYLSMQYVPFHRLLAWEGMEYGRTAVEWAARMGGQTTRQFLRSGLRLGVEPVVDLEGMGRHWRRMGRDCVTQGGMDVSHHVDRPLVDYIRLYQPGDQINTIPRMRYVDRKAGRKPESRHDFQNLGLGLLLYVEGAKWMAEQGMKLHASSLQRPEAIRAWASMARRFPDAISHIRQHGYRDQPETWRTTLDGAALPLDWRPPNTRSLVTHVKPQGMPLHCNNTGDVQGMEEYLARKQEDARRNGREPMGGEGMPPTPLLAIKARQAFLDTLASPVQDLEVVSAYAP